MRVIREVYDQLAITLQEGDVERALRYLDVICQEQEDDGAAWELRGLLLAQTNRPAEAVCSFERASLLIPLEPWSSRIMAIQYIGVGKTKLGIDLLTELGKSSVLATPLIRMVSHDLLTIGHPERAAEVVSHAIKRCPDDATLWHELAAVQSVLGEDAAVCLETVSRAIELLPDAVEFRVTAATLLIRMDQILEAYQLVRQVVSNDSIDLDCDCCLWRLIHLFSCFDDHARMQICYRRLNRSRVPVASH